MTKTLSEQELHALLNGAAAHVKVGASYMHYKQKTYTVMGLALLEATTEPAVIYQAQYGKKLTFIRPVSDWLATVEVEGKHIPRFSRVNH